MANSLGTASLLLTANNAPLSNTLGKTEKDVRGWASRVGGVLKSSMKVAGIGAAGALAAGIGALAAVNPFERIADIAKQGDIAMSLGLTAEAFTSIAGVAKSAGSDTRDFLEGLVTLSGKALEAAAGRGEETVRIFQELKVNADEFSRLNPEQQFYKLFEALNQVQNPAQRVNLLLKAVGEDTGKNMVSLLGKSTDELKALGEQFKVNTKDMAEAQVAAQQLTVAKAQLNKALDQVAIALAPVAAILADQLPKAIEFCKATLTEFGPPVLDVLKKVAQGVGFMLDVWESAKGVVQIAVGGLVMIFGKLAEAMGDLLGLAARLNDKLPAALKVPGLSEAARDLKNFGKDTFGAGLIVGDEGLAKVKEFGKRQAETAAWFDGLMAAREKKVAAQVAKLQPGTFQQDVRPQVNMVAPAVKGSAEATKIVQGWAFGAKLKDDIQKQQLAKQVQANQILEQIKLALQVSGVVRFGVI